jgi:response regulator RpfG family c-di-GMP phosphodiesterase
MISEKTKILIVDDTPENLDILQGLLQDEYQLFAAPAGEIAFQIAKKQVPDQANTAVLVLERILQSSLQRLWAVLLQWNLLNSRGR